MFYFTDGLHSLQSAFFSVPRRSVLLISRRSRGGEYTNAHRNFVDKSGLVFLYNLMAVAC